jgi:hypothetical protein
MLYGAELGKAIATYPDDIEAALTVFEEALFRAARRKPRTRLVLELCLGDGAPFSLIDFFAGALEGSTNDGGAGNHTEMCAGWNASKTTPARCTTVFR